MERKAVFTSTEVRQFVSRPLFDPKLLVSKDPSYPRISVVVCSYNQARFLERTILSVLNQNYPNTELIIIDGGSKDGSVKLIEKYEPYIAYWVSKPDRGQPSAINKGFERASGEIIGWQNSDDLYLPGFFYTVAESLRTYPRSELLVGNVYIIDEDDRIRWGTRFIPFSVGHLIYLDWNLSSQATFVRRRLVERVGALREDIQVAFDWDWFIRVGKLAKYIVLHKAYGGCYRIHRASKLMTYSKRSRWLIDMQILRSHDIRVREELPYKQQTSLQARLLKLRMVFYVIMLYDARIPRQLRRVFVWGLERLRIVCKEFV
jgi:glycosyltransferase involved in cell wall biosynthesis